MKVLSWICYCLVVLGALSQAAIGQEQVLARVELQGSPASYSLPVHAMLQDAEGHDYLLVFATVSSLDQAAWPWRELGRPGSVQEILLATEMRAGARLAAFTRFFPWHDDGRRWILRAAESEGEALAMAGFAVQRLDPEPVVWSPGPNPRLPRRPGTIRYGDDPAPGFDPLVGQMVDSVASTNLWWLMRRLTGEEPVVAEQGAYTLTNRHTAAASNIRKATAFAFERLQTLGLAPVYEPWSGSGYSARNVLATRPGTTRSNELVLVTAHLDDMPSSGRAPGADDNASGSAAVLTAAGIFARHTFERSIRFILFTGEEQGLLGSAVSASNSVAAGENIVAVLNLDMIAWDNTGLPVFQLHTRSTNHAAFSNDLAIVSVFTNCVAAYGLSNSLTPRLMPDGESASDHARYWNRGFPAVLGIEDYGPDFTTYYHKSTDALSTLNLRFMTAAVKASVAAVAHLAGTVAVTPADVVTLVASDMRSNSGLGCRTFAARHAPGAADTEPELLDLPLESLPPLTNAYSLAPASAPYGQPLLADTRSTASESDFVLNLAVGGTPGTSLTTSNRLRFEFPMPPLPERLYNTRVRVPAQYTTNAADFLCVTNLRALLERGGQIQLPNLVSVPVGSNYGTVEISARFVDQSPDRCGLRWVGLQGTVAQFEVETQVGATLIDAIEYSSALASNQWTTVLVTTNRVAPTDATFASGWTRTVYPVDLSALPTGDQRYFRLKRTWLTEW